jgi:signal transduction histidine kinase
MHSTGAIQSGQPEASETPNRSHALSLRRMERLLEISQSLSATLDLGRLLRKIVHAARELTDSEASSIMLLDPHTGELRFETSTNRNTASLEGVAVPVEGSIAGWVAANAEPLIVHDAPSDSRWNPTVDQLTAFVTHSILAVPLINRGQALGTLEAVNKLHGRFDEDDLSTLKLLAAQAAIAIVNARLFVQSDLVAELVHELRTPLAALTSASHLLQRPGLTDEQRSELAATLQRETSRLAEMATGFLDMARLESGRAVFHLDWLDLPSLASECIEVVRPQAAEKSIVVLNDVPANLPSVRSDKKHIKQVLLNLLTNAVKYNRPGGQVRVHAERGTQGILVSVADTGLGIPTAALPRIFERFYRVPDSEGYATGTGLGLPITRRIVEALGGEIGVESLVSVGTRFFFTLPLEPKKTGPLRG